MQFLQERFSVIKCEVHALPIEFVCFEIKCHHKHRQLCSKCPKSESSFGIEQLAEFLKVEKSNSDMKWASITSNLRQLYGKLRDSVLEHLQHLEESMEQNLVGMQKMSAVNQVYQHCYSKLWKAEDVETLGRLLSRSGELGIDHKYKLIVEQDIHQNYIHLIEKFKNMISVLPKEAMQKQPKLDRKYKLVQTLTIPCVGNHLTLNHDETQLVVAGNPNIYIYKLGDAGMWINECQVLVGHYDQVSQVKFNNDSTALVSSGWDKFVMIWRQDKKGVWMQVDKFKDHANIVLSINFNRDCSILATSSSDSSIRLYKYTNGNYQFQQVLTEHPESVYDVCFNIDSSLMASACYDGHIVIWSQDNNNHWIPKQTLSGHDDCVFKLCFNMNSTMLLSGSWDSSIRIWQLGESKQWEQHDQLIGHTQAVGGIVINNRSDTIVSASDDATVRVWQLIDNIWQSNQLLCAHSKCVKSVLINNDSTMIISTGDDNTIQVYKV